MSARQLTVAILLTLAAGPAAADTARATLNVRARIVRSVAVRSVLVAESRSVVGAPGAAVSTTVRGGGHGVPPAELRTERIGADGTKEVLVTVLVDGAPPSMTVRTGS